MDTFKPSIPKLRLKAVKNFKREMSNENYDNNEINKALYVKKIEEADTYTLNFKQKRKSSSESTNKPSPVLRKHTSKVKVNDIKVRLNSLSMYSEMNHQDNNVFRLS